MRYAAEMTMGSASRRILRALVFAVICGIAAPQVTAAPACTAPVGPPLAADKIKGIRTKWLSLRPDARNSIEPDLAHLPLNVWMKDLEAVGVNLAEINLEPQRKLAPRPHLSPEALKQTLDAIYTPQNRRSAEQSERVLAFENDIAPHWDYTRQQRDDIQLDFLRRLEALRRKGEIAGTARFIIHQRLWFRQGDRPRQVFMRQQRTQELAQDMATFIRRADAECLGHWIAGIRLGENSNTDMNELLPVIVNIARAVNAQTGGWLKSHLYVANGGGWGANYRGIAHVVGPDGRPFPFFPAIAAETGAFTFGYKFMQFHRTAPGIKGHMAIATCAPSRYCNVGSVVDWREYLGRILGFDELVSYLKANRREYPADANVVFVGAADDAVTEMMQLGPGSRLSDGPAMAALRRLFIDAGQVATSGKLFMNGYNTAANWRRPVEFSGGGGPVDVGRALYFVDDAGKARLLPESYRTWKDWPRP